MPIILRIFGFFYLVIRLVRLFLTVDELESVEIIKTSHFTDTFPEK